MKNSVLMDNPTQHATTTPSLSRWWRQLTFIPMLQERWLNAETQTQLTAAIQQAEKGHRGEVVLIIEHALPLDFAYRHDSRERAIGLFSEYRVWDTQENTGVLVYLNLCEQRLEIVADRGISAKVGDGEWQAVCNQALMGIQAGQPVAAMQQLLQQIGQRLRSFYPAADDPFGNELSDAVIVLK